jgi:hypothetical protein
MMTMTRDELNEAWSPDTVAECCTVTKEMQARLWELVPADVKLPGEDDWPEWPRCSYAWTGKLTDDEFAIVVAAVEAYPQ